MGSVLRNYKLCPAQMAQVNCWQWRRLGNEIGIWCCVTHTILLATHFRHCGRIAFPCNSKFHLYIKNYSIYDCSSNVSEHKFGIAQFKTRQTTVTVFEIKKLLHSRNAASTCTNEPMNRQIYHLSSSSSKINIRYYFYFEVPYWAQQMWHKYSLKLCRGRIPIYL